MDKELLYYADLELSEFDKNANHQSRQIIAKYINKHGGVAWIGKINLYKNGCKVMQACRGSLTVCNFGADFVIPKYDEKLEQLILDRAKAIYTGPGADVARIEVIFDRIYELGGSTLNWA